MPITIRNAALDELPGERLIVRGSIEPTSLQYLKVEHYQREVIPQSVQELQEALNAGQTLPDIELGLRKGGDFTERAGRITLIGELFIIDGRQRVAAALANLVQGKPAVLGALVHFDTTESWERERFEVLNVKQRKLSPNVILRNKGRQYPAISLLYTMTTGGDWCMVDRVAWKQAMRKEELISAMGLAKVIGRLHLHMRMGTGHSSVLLLSEGLQAVYNLVGHEVYKANIETFFDVLDQAFGIRQIAFREGSVHMRGTFLLAIARLFSENMNFWDNTRLVIEKKTVTKLKSFPIGDPSVRLLTQAGGTSTVVQLYNLLQAHLTTGRGRITLTPRSPQPLASESTGDEGTESLD